MRKDGREVIEFERASTAFGASALKMFKNYCVKSMGAVRELGMGLNLRLVTQNCKFDKLHKIVGKIRNFIFLHI